MNHGILIFFGGGVNTVGASSLFPGPAHHFCGVCLPPCEPSVPASLLGPAHAFTCALSAICPLPAVPAHPRSPTARSAANKGKEKPQADPSLKPNTSFVRIPKEKRVRGLVGYTRTALSRKRYKHFFQELPGKISFAGARLN